MIIDWQVVAWWEERAAMKHDGTPADAGLSMPAEWSPQSGCLVSWPCNEDTWSGFFPEAKAAFAAVIEAISAFEPVVVLSDASTYGEACRAVGRGAHVIEVPLDDSWIRDNGPIFVTSDEGDSAIAHFGFNGWGGRFPPFDRDAAIPEVMADKMRMRRYGAPMILEGGAISVDGEGTLLTTESCLLNPNRNPDMTREEVEDVIKSYLGVRRILWLKQGIHESIIDGHVDGVAVFARPATVVAASTDDENDPNRAIMNANRARLETMTDARGRSIEVVDLPMPKRREVNGNRMAPCYTNFLIAQGGVVAPIFGDENDEEAIATPRSLFPEREIVGIRCEHIGVGGGEVHCITQQVPRAAYSGLARLIE